MPPPGMAVRTCFRPKRRSPRRKKWSSVSGTSCIRPCTRPTVRSGGMEQPVARRRIPLVWLLAPYVVVVAAGYVSDVLAPNLVTHHPLLLMWLNPKNRYLILASPHVGVEAFFIVGFIR